MTKFQILKAELRRGGTSPIRSGIWVKKGKVFLASNRVYSVRYNFRTCSAIYNEINQRADDHRQFLFQRETTKAADAAYAALAATLIQRLKNQ